MDHVSPLVKCEGIAVAAWAMRAAYQDYKVAGLFKRLLDDLHVSVMERLESADEYGDVMLGCH